MQNRSLNSLFLCAKTMYGFLTVVLPFLLIFPSHGFIRAANALIHDKHIGAITAIDPLLEKEVETAIQKYNYNSQSFLHDQNFSTESFGAGKNGYKEVDCLAPQLFCTESNVVVHGGESNRNSYGVDLQNVKAINEFKPYNWRYAELVDSVHNPIFDASIGFGCTIIPVNGSKFDQFTQVFAESEWSRLKSEEGEWSLSTSSTRGFWLVTGVILIYTGLIVWFLDPGHPEFKGPWKERVGTVLWFAFSTRLYSHRERIHSNFTLVTVVIGLFVVLIFASSYIASRTSMLTVTQLQPNVTDIRLLNLTKRYSKVGSDGESIMTKYLETALDVKLKYFLDENRTLPSEFLPYNGTYEDLVDYVRTKIFEAVVGDITVLANRLKYAEFSQPYAESGFSMIVPLISKENTWMILKPFTIKLWLATGAIFIYTTFVVWFLEHQSNSAFRGPWRNQLSTALWFTFCSLFFSHREKIHNNLTRVVVVIWLFIVLVVTTSYTATFTSMLTSPQLQPSVTDIAWLKKTNSKIGCDGNSIVREFLVDELKFKSDNIKNISNEEDYIGEFKSGNILAAFLELPNQIIFLNKYRGFIATGPVYQIGGLGSVPRGSPKATSVSKTIPNLLENERLKDLNEFRLKLAPSFECSCSKCATEVESLSLHSFWGIYLISAATSTSCFMICLVGLLLKNYRRNHQELAMGDMNVWSKMVRLITNFHKNGESLSLAGTQTLEWIPPVAQTPDDDEWSSSMWVHISISNSVEDVQILPPV